MPDLSPSSFDQLSERLLNDEAIAIKYHNTQDNGGGETHVDNCDETCRRALYCKQRNTVYAEAQDCMGKQHIDIENNFLDSFLSILANPWYKKSI